jgi:hypothetical protein
VTRKGLQSRSKWLGVAFLLAACGGREGDTAPDTAAPPDDTQPATAADAELEAAARNVIGFLRGNTPFDSVPLADSVALYVAPEGGGGRSIYSREALRQPSSWKVTSGQRTFALAPPPGMDSLTTKAGRHFNCREYDLASRHPELARQPHVGTRLEPARPASCLQSWNLTLVFDSTAQRRLTAAVYDQWEW